MNSTTKKTRAPSYFKPDGSIPFAAPHLSRFSLRWGRLGLRAVSVYDWNGDRVPGMGAGGCGYDKRGTCLGQVVTALAGQAGMEWLARTYGQNTGSGDRHGDSGLYGLWWRIVAHPDAVRATRGAAREALHELARDLTAKAHARSHKAPRRLPGTMALAVSLDGACGVDAMHKAALSLGIALDRVDCGEWADAYTVRPVRVVREATTYTRDDGTTYQGRAYLRVGGAA